MPKLLFKLNHVPDDEADEIRQLLESESIDFYETSSGVWGLLFASIWIKEDAQWEKAKNLLAQYQQQRYQNAQQSGEKLNHWQSFKRSPFKTIAVVLFVAALTYFSLSPFFPA